MIRRSPVREGLATPGFMDSCHFWLPDISNSLLNRLINAGLRQAAIEKFFVTLTRLAFLLDHGFQLFIDFLSAFRCADFDGSKVEDGFELV